MDSIIQKAIHYLTSIGEVKWNKFPPVGVEDYYHEWYYAEGRQYIIHDVMMDTFFFVKARSPREAYELYQGRIERVEQAGKMG